ncbi:hypothetical protein [Priestia megaterium]|uniref:hypothetical protein n=1 Tax=Priestia megaterium TaxID=1404 RepID=UPI00345A813E
MANNDLIQRIGEFVKKQTEIHGERKFVYEHQPEGIESRGYEQAMRDIAEIINGVNK